MHSRIIFQSPLFYTLNLHSEIFLEICMPIGKMAFSAVKYLDFADNGTNLLFIKVDSAWEECSVAEAHLLLEFRAESFTHFHVGT